jgi:transcriptional regulator with XRE-family HTH domain
MDADESRAEARRQALKKIMNEKDVTAADVARMAELPTANAIYNFLSGRSRSLSAETYEKIAKAIPGVSVSELTGLSEGKARKTKPVSLRAIAEAGVWRDRFDLPLSEQAELALPVTQEQILAGAFAVKLQGVGAEKRWPAGATLLCVPALSTDVPICSGRWVILERQLEGKVEVTARQVEVENGKAWLWLRTGDPRQNASAAIPVAWPTDGRPWKNGNERLQIAGVVLLACEPLV